MWLLKQVPKTLLDLAESPGPEELRLLHLLDPVDPQELPGLVVALLAARLQVELINPPEIKILSEGHGTALLSQVESASPVEIDHGAKVARMTIKIIFIVVQVELITQLKDVGSVLGSPQLAQSGLGQTLQEGP